jgi:cytoskeletal protein CcmA (bactofilin family)
MSQSPDAPGVQSSASARGERSYFAAGARLSGDLSVPGVLELLGQFDGKMSADAVVIEESGSAVGEIHAASVAVKGRFEGKIFGGDVKLHAGAKASGEIVYQTLSIESGAEVNSSCSRKKANET